MRRYVVLGILVVVGGLSAGVAALQQPPAGRGGQPAPMVIEVQKLHDNFFVLRGGGGNTAVYITAGGVTLVDTKIPGWGKPLIEKLQELTDKPVTTIINTHTHFDHVGGNVDFPTTVEFVAHENTKANMEKGLPPKGLEKLAGPDVFKANNGKNMAERTYKDRMTLGSGNERVELYYFGRAHTNGDTFVLFPTLRVLHTGDVFPNKGIPIMDQNNGGSAISYADTVAKAAALPNIDVVVTGHSPNMTIADLKEYSEFNRDFVQGVQAAKKAGRTIDDVVSTWKIPDRFKGYAQPMPDRLRANVEVVWEETR
jgi:glyoxylase-like metal-dependent hydrolase (beta-lactamase superfamily II)